jgi:K+-sensing histidine kinase KdpD
MRMELRKMSTIERMRPLPGGGAMTGQLRVYFGAAPGVGKTYKMLEEAHRRLSRGTDVVVGFVETHGRRPVAGLVEGLEVVPERRSSTAAQRWRKWILRLS